MSTMPPGAEGPRAGEAGTHSALLLGLFVALVALTAMDVLGGAGGAAGGAEASSAAESGGPKDIPKPKYASMLAGPTIRFLYW